MIDYLRNQRGVVSVSIIFISLIIFVILTSLLNLLNDSINSISSNNDHYRANYISESALELKVTEIMELSDKIIKDYLIDLQSYKIEYIKEVNRNPHINYNPPNFSIYVTQKLVPEIKKLGYSKSNPFEEYKEDHSWRIEIEYNSSQKVINILSTGTYNRARRFIKAKLELPKVIEMGFDEYNLPKVSIMAVNILEYYQTFGE